MRKLICVLAGRTSYCRFCLCADSNSSILSMKKTTTKNNNNNNKTTTKKKKKTKTKKNPTVLSVRCGALECLHGGVLTFCAFFSFGISDVACFSARRCCCWGAAACPGRAPWGCSNFLRLFFSLVSPISLAEGNPEEGVCSVYRWYGGSKREVLPR